MLAKTAVADIGCALAGRTMIEWPGRLWIGGAGEMPREEARRAVQGPAARMRSVHGIVWVVGEALSTEGKRTLMDSGSELDEEKFSFVGRAQM